MKSRSPVRQSDVAAAAGVVPATPSVQTGASALVAAAPIRDHLQMLRNTHESMRQLMPDADAVQLLCRMGDALQGALERAERDTAFLTISEVASRLRLSEEAVRWNVRRGHLKAFRVGREYRVSLEDLLYFISRTESKGANE